ncbi:hypothetical protein AB0N29_19550 [Nocardioides sp. NPDC092400]|uniref:competence protein CoiA family protein n=1 Tax=Nocardioides sp. NPDC092400 TaxID=3155196 RepID=UPI00343553C9
MARAVHGDLVRFLRGESRQVWALHRETGNPFYLPEGRAEAMRDFTKASLKCPHPNCSVPISTRGSPRVRDHFWHTRGTPHETGRESEDHLAGKAMLVQWAATRIPDGAVVVPEQSVKDPLTRALRRPDVLVTGQTGRRVAYEVEYKNWPVEAWRRKQNDLDGQGIVCAWLIGHTRLSQPSGWPEPAVRVPALAAEIARAAHQVLVVNPATREIGTLATDSTFLRHYRGEEAVAWMAIDSIDDCDFSPSRGMITPTMRRIAAAEAERAERDRTAREKAARRDTARVAEEERLRARYEALVWAWEQSDLHATFIDRWGEVPHEFEADTGWSWGIHAALPHWHAVIYEELLGGRNDDFIWRDVFQALDRHMIPRSTTRQHVYGAISRWMEHLRHLGLLKSDRSLRTRVRAFTPTGRTLDEARAARQEARARLDARVLDQTAAPHRGVPFVSESRHVERRTRPVILEDGRRRWIPVNAPDPPGSRRPSPRDR